MKKAFTLIELLVVIAIVAILVGLAAPLFSSRNTKTIPSDSYNRDIYNR